MLINSIVAVGLRCVGIFLALTQLQVLIYAFFTRQPISNSIQVFQYSAAFLFVVALLLILFPANISRLILSGIETNKTSEKLSFQDLQFVVFGGIGTYFLVSVALNLVSFVSNFAIHGRGINLISPIIFMFMAQFIIGLWLLTDAKGARELVQKIRNAGSNR